MNQPIYIYIWAYPINVKTIDDTLMLIPSNLRCQHWYFVTNILEPLSNLVQCLTKKTND